MKKYLGLLLLVVLAGSCDNDTTEPEQGIPEPQLTFLRFESENALAVRTKSFWAVKGQGRKLEMEYADGEDFLEFEVDSNSLLRAPDGRTYQRGDSVKITVTVDPGNRMIVYFEPSGLTFSQAQPAKLEINYNKADDDIDGNGRRDNKDDALEAQLKVWKQEQPGQPWLPQSSFRLDDRNIEARIMSFTGFAMAS